MSHTVALKEIELVVMIKRRKRKPKSKSFDEAKLTLIDDTRPVSPYENGKDVEIHHVVYNPKAMIKM